MSESFWPSFRASRINQILNNSNSVSLQDMIELQLDNTNMLAKTILPHMLSGIVYADLNKNEIEVYNKIKNWNYQNINNSIGASIFDLWFKKIEENTWIDNLGKQDEYTKWPAVDKLSELIESNQSSSWFDNKETDTIETLTDICNQSFYDVCKKDINKMVDVFVF